MTPELPAVYFIEDVCRVLRVSRRSVERLRHHRAFPIPEIPSFDKRPRWSRAAVERFIEAKGQLAGVRRRA